MFRILYVRITPINYYFYKYKVSPFSKSILKKSPILAQVYMHDNKINIRGRMLSLWSSSTGTKKLCSTYYHTYICIYIHILYVCIFFVCINIYVCVFPLGVRTHFFSFFFGIFWHECMYIYMHMYFRVVIVVCDFFFAKRRKKNPMICENDDDLHSIYSTFT